MADPTPQELDNRITQAQSTADDAKNDINTHRYNLDIHVTLEWKNSVVLKETLGLYWTSAQVADKFADVQKQIDDIIAGGGGGGDLSRYATKTYVTEQLQGYLQLVGGALTGNLIERNTDSDHLGICGAYWGHGAYLWLSGQNSGYSGSWYLSARDSERSCDLVGSPSGVLSWGGKLVITEDNLTDYVKNTDFATSTKGGVIKFSTSHGVTMSADGFLMGATRTAEQYNSNSGNMLINKGTLENVLNNRGQDWEFTLSDGSTVTKKVVCAQEII